MELIHVVTGGLSGLSVCSDSAPDLILYNQHSQFLQLLTEFLDVVADQPVVDIDVGSVVEEIQ